MFKDTYKGKTFYCLACEEEERGIKSFELHTCGKSTSQIPIHKEPESWEIDFDGLWGGYPANKIEKEKGLDFMVKQFIRKLLKKTNV